jgi:ribose-phosphate pyrophosphokinase
LWKTHPLSKIPLVKKLLINIFAALLLSQMQNTIHSGYHEAQIFSGHASEELAEEICDIYGCDLGKVNIQKFKDGEISTNYIESVRGDYVFCIQSTYSPTDNLMELLLMIDAAKRASAYKVVAVIPYYGYARQDRKDRPRVAIGSKLIANMLTAAGADRIITMDLHAPQIQGYFDIPVDHLDSHAVFIPYIEKLQLKNLTFAAPDVGSTKRIREISSYFNVDMVICDKSRKRANEIASMTLIGEVDDRDVVIIDDMCDTGGTLAKCAELIKEKGARSVRAMITHPVLSGNAYEIIENSVLEELVVCNTIPLKKESSKIKVISVARLFATTIKHAFENKSITGLFIHSNLKKE